MRTVPFQSVLDSVCYKLGIDPERDLTAAQAYTIVDAINTALREAWEDFQWPEFIETQQRFYKPVWNAATAYVVGNAVYFGGAYYTAILAGTNFSPATNPLKWVVLTDYSRLVALEQPGLTPMGEILGVYPSDPRNSFTRATDFLLLGDGLYTARVEGGPWIQYRLRCPVFTIEEYDVAKTDYRLGALVYVPARGECYQLTEVLA